MDVYVGVYDLVYGEWPVGCICMFMLCFVSVGMLLFVCCAYILGVTMTFMRVVMLSVMLVL